MVHRAGGSEPYFVQLLTVNGQGGAWVQATTRSEKVLYFARSRQCPQGAICGDGETANSQMPETSISSTHVYFLDGESVIKSLAPDGIVAVVQSISAPANSQVVFAVSPDDRRVAVSVITLATGRLPNASFSDQMYVEDLVTGSNRVDLYSSSTLAEWPVGWHAGDVVVAAGTSELGTDDNVYGAIGYQVIDPATGQPVDSLDCAFGLLVAAGTACATGGCAFNPGPCTAVTLAAQAWDGNKHPFVIPSGPSANILRGGLLVHLSPDGTRIAAEEVTNQLSGAGSTILFESGKATVIAQDYVPQGWLDSSHLVLGSADVVEVMDVNTGTSLMTTGLQRIPNQGVPQLAGVMPANLG
jgi:hypothetical protein